MFQGAERAVVMLNIPTVGASRDRAMWEGWRVRFLPNRAAGLFYYHQSPPCVIVLLPLYYQYMFINL